MMMRGGDATMRMTTDVETSTVDRETTIDAVHATDPAKSNSIAPSHHINSNLALSASSLLTLLISISICASFKSNMACLSPLLDPVLPVA